MKIVVNTEGRLLITCDGQDAALFVLISTGQAVEVEERGGRIYVEGKDRGFYVECSVKELR